MKKVISSFLRTMMVISVFASTVSFADQPDLLNILGIKGATPFFQNVMPEAKARHNYTEVLNNLLPAGKYYGHTSTLAKKCLVVVSSDTISYKVEIFSGQGFAKRLGSVVIGPDSPATHILSKAGPNGVPVIGILNAVDGKLKATFTGTWLEGSSKKPNTEIVINGYSGDNESYGFTSQHCQRLVEAE